MLLIRPPSRDVVAPFQKLHHLALSLMTRDWKAEYRQTQKMIVMMGRYCGQSMDEVEDWEMHKLALRVELMSELVTEENKKSVPTGPAGHPRP